MQITEIEVSKMNKAWVLSMKEFKTGHRQSARHLREWTQKCGAWTAQGPGVRVAVSCAQTT